MTVVSSQARAMNFENAAPRPAGFDGLLELGGNVAADNGPSTPLYEAFDLLSDDEVDQVRYFCLGEAAAKFAVQLADPATRQNLVEQAASAVTDNHGEYVSQHMPDSRGRGIHALEINGNVMSKGVRPYAVSAFAELSPQTRQVADAVSRYSLARKKEHAGDKKVDPDGSQMPNREQTDIAHSLAINLFSGAGLVVQRAVLLNTPPELFKPSTEKPGAEILVRDVISPEELRNVEINKAARRGARLHMDEVEEVFTDAAFLDAAGNLRIDSQKIPAKPQRNPLSSTPFAKSRALHNIRLSCPALFVRPFIPLVMDMMPDIIEAADQGIQQKWSALQHVRRSWQASDGLPKS